MFLHKCISSGCRYAPQNKEINYDITSVIIGNFTINLFCTFGQLTLYLILLKQWRSQININISFAIYNSSASTHENNIRNHKSYSVNNCSCFLSLCSLQIVDSICINGQDLHIPQTLGYNSTAFHVSDCLPSNCFRAA